MSQSRIEMPAALYGAYAEANSNFFYPRGTVRCSAFPMFRSHIARDLGCLLDVDRHVVAWLCLPIELHADFGPHVPDFMVDFDDGSRVFMDAVDREGNPSVSEAAAIARVHHRFVSKQQIESGYRLQNARDLLRYANFKTPLNDRVRLLAALEEAGSLNIGECWHLFREMPAMTGIASMILNRMIETDLDEAPIGPESVLRRYQR